MAGLLLVACGGLPLVGGGVVGVSHSPLKVALVDVFSGSPSSDDVGTAVQDSLQVEIDALNARGGLLGSRLQLVTADDKYSGATTADVTRRLLADRSVKLLVGPSFAGLHLAAKPLVESARIPNCLTNMAADDLMSSARFSFRAGAADAAHLPTLLGYLQRSGQLHKVGLVTASDSIGAGYDRQLSDQAGRFGLQYVGAAFAPATGDQKAQVQQLLQRGAEAVVLSDDPAVATRTLQAIKAANAAARLRPFGFSGLGSYRFVQQAGDPAGGLVFTSTIQAYLSDVPDTRWPPAYRDFARAVLARYGPAQDGVAMKGEPAAADCILQWARAVQAAGTFDGAQVAKAWEGMDVPLEQSALGVHEHFSAEDHDAVAPESLFVYQWAHAGDHWSLHQLAGPPA